MTLYFFQFTNGQTAVGTGSFSLIHTGDEPIKTVPFEVSEVDGKHLLDNPTEYTMQLVGEQVVWGKK